MARVRSLKISRFGQFHFNLGFFCDKMLIWLQISPTLCNKISQFDLRQYLYTLKSAKLVSRQLKLLIFRVQSCRKSGTILKLNSEQIIIVPHSFALALTGPTGQPIRQAEASVFPSFFSQLKSWFLFCLNFPSLGLKKITAYHSEDFGLEFFTSVFQK